MVSLPPAIVCKTLVQSKKNIDITRRFPQEGTVNKFIIDFLIRVQSVFSRGPISGPGFFLPKYLKNLKSHPRQ